MKLFDSVAYVKGVGPKRAELLKKLGVETVYDLLYFFPRTYIDYTSPTAISQTALDEQNVIKCRICSKLPPAHIRKGMTIYKAFATDDESDITVILYNSEYLFKSLEVGGEYIMYGKVTGNLTRREISSPLIISEKSDDKIQPVYHLTDGISQTVIRKAVKNALLMFDSFCFEPLSKEILSDYGICALRYALENIHFPRDMNEFYTAKKRLVFEEFLILQLGMQILRKRNRQLTGCKMTYKSIESYYKSLPFELTNAQKSAISDCLSDMTRDVPMNRLVQGDVGSGKTAVAAACCYFAHLNGRQSALMAPTEILAAQHYSTLSSFLSPLGVNVCLLTGSLTPKQKKEIKEKIKSGYFSVIVGTHALVVSSTNFESLGLVIIDEQHRFGVKQRAGLAQKGDNPHMLVMSATPIPRTLALMIYGDLDISVLNELPKGRQKIDTYAVTGKLRKRAYGFIKERLDEGRQAYIVCPAIDETESGLLAANSYAEKIAAEDFHKYRIGILNGKMPSSQKDEIMARFKEHQLDVLVSTTVIEVGIDVPNAAVMLIENADRFGLSQLHQLRGRVGRGSFKSYCILVTDNVSEESKKRLKILSSTSDGFKISEEDLKLRGPGDFFGSKQHGLPQLKIASMAENMEELRSAQQCAEKIISADPNLLLSKHAQLKLLAKRLFQKSADNAMN